MAKDKKDNPEVAIKPEVTKPEVAIKPVDKFTRGGILGSVRYGKYRDMLAGYLMDGELYSEKDIKTILKENYGVVI